jgi:hypothetical protein
MRGWGHALVWIYLLGSCGKVKAQDPRQIVQQAVQTELAADAADHSHWLYREVDRKPNLTVRQWVADTSNGDLTRLIEKNGVTFTEAQQRQNMNNYIQNATAQAKQRRGNQHDDQQAKQMLSMLPQAFLWSLEGEHGNETTLRFKPDPRFQPPTWESRVFAAMAGEMTVDNTQHRIVSLKGRMIHDVKFFYGLLGSLQAGGTFDVERRQLAPGIWQITETHVHITGHALIFKSISEQEDDVKSKFKELHGTVSLESAERTLLEQNG